MIFSVVAVVMFSMSVTVKGQNLGRHPIKKESIVADRHYRSFISIERRLKRFARGDIQMIRRFVEHQHVHA